mmetsp:Transcript_91299/g.244489  ORF Transcript_91299/g.244489 Transcript_91299/m.244489 type:complete len:139 (-) Transcript_91299:1-417(-)
MLTPRLSVNQIVGLPEQKAQPIPNFVLSKLHKELGSSFKPFEKGRDWSDEDIKHRIMSECPREKLEAWLQTACGSPPASPPRLLKTPEIPVGVLASEVVSEVRRKYFQADKSPVMDWKLPDLPTSSGSGKLTITSVKQ